MADIKKSLCASSDKGLIHALSSNPVCIVFSVCQQPKHKGAFIPLLVRSLCCLSKRRLKALILTQLIYVSIHFGHLVQVVSMCRKPTRLFALPIFLPVSWWNAKMSARSIKIVRVPCHY